MPRASAIDLRERTPWARDTGLTAAEGALDLGISARPHRGRRLPAALPAALLAGPQPDRAGRRHGLASATPGRSPLLPPAMLAAAGPALATVTPVDARAFFRHTGLPLPPNPVNLDDDRARVRASRAQQPRAWKAA
ncbi:MAG: hypothetical protein ACRDJH_22585 [Thermomicrobiales bacterium]